MLFIDRKWIVSKNIQKALNEETNFEQNLNDLKTGLLYDIYDTKYAFSKKHVIEYIDKIATEITFTEQETIKINEYRKKIEKMSASNFNYSNK